VTRVRFSSAWDGRPTPAWVEEARRRAGAQRRPVTFVSRLSALPEPIDPEEKPEEKPARPKRDWLATGKEKPAWRL